MSMKEYHRNGVGTSLRADADYFNFNASRLFDVEQSRSSFRSGIGNLNWQKCSDAHYNLRNALTMRGNYADAVAQFRAAVDINPEDAYA